MHPKNKHKGNYNFNKLIQSYPQLSKFVSPNKAGLDSINFFNPLAIKALNTALLIRHYKIEYWDIPDGFLCPPIPGRADYIHHMAEFLISAGIKQDHFKKVKCLDIGVGANCIYPLIGHQEYGWNFIGSDISRQALSCAQKIIDKNPMLEGKIKLRFQKKAKHIFKGVTYPNEKFTLSICNPPFYSSAEEAEENTRRKLKNLTQSNSPKLVRNFKGQHQELWCKGGEKQFLTNMIHESKWYKDRVQYFSTILSSQALIQPLTRLLKSQRASSINIIPMELGHKKSRLLVWSFQK